MVEAEPQSGSNHLAGQGVTWRGSTGGCAICVPYRDATRETPLGGGALVQRWRVATLVRRPLVRRPVGAPPRGHAAPRVGGFAWVSASRMPECRAGSAPRRGRLTKRRLYGRGNLDSPAAGRQRWRKPPGTAARRSLGARCAEARLPDVVGVAQRWAGAAGRPLRPALGRVVPQRSSATPGRALRSAPGPRRRSPAQAGGSSTGAAIDAGARAARGGSSRKAKALM